jgi:hypothetical protein
MKCTVRCLMLQEFYFISLTMNEDSHVEKQVKHVHSNDKKTTEKNS